MGEQRRMAVILIRNDPAVMTPTVEDFRKMILDGEYSVKRFWDDSTLGWFEWTSFDFYGWYDVQLPPPPSDNQTINQIAQQAANIDTNNYDTCIVVVYPGTDYTWYSTDGIGKHHTATMTSATIRMQSQYCHEVGHLLGFDHTYGLFNDGIDQNPDDNDKVHEMSYEYGDPYCIMSDLSDAHFTVPPAAQVSTIPNGNVAGALLSRANLHFSLPQALESKGKAAHVYQATSNPVTLSIPGRERGYFPELLVYHPQSEDGDGRNRIYVEYRRFFGIYPATRWDQGLDEKGSSRCRGGLIVHVVKDKTPDDHTPVVWYAARIVLPTYDIDVDVTVGKETFTVKVDPKFASQTKPEFVRVSIAPKIPDDRGIHINKSPYEEQTLVIASEQRSIPGWEWAGMYLWEKREHIRSCDYTPYAWGIGSKGTDDAPTPVKFRWYIENRMLQDGNGTVSVYPLSGPKYVELSYQIDPQSKVLTLNNAPTDFDYTVQIEANAYTDDTSLTAYSTFEAVGTEEGWGKDYDDFGRFWERLKYRIPKYQIGPPHEDPYLNHIRMLKDAAEKIEDTHPELANQLRTFIRDKEVLHGNNDE